MHTDPIPGSLYLWNVATIGQHENRLIMQIICFPRSTKAINTQQQSKYLLVTSSGNVKYLKKCLERTRTKCAHVTAAMARMEQRNSRKKGKIFPTQKKKVSQKKGGDVADTQTNGVAERTSLTTNNNKARQNNTRISGAVGHTFTPQTYTTAKHGS